MRRLLPLPCAAAAALVVSALVGVPALACTLDSRPSAYADGRIDIPNPALPTSGAQLASWSPFVFAHTVRMHRTVTLTENRREVARSLTAAAMRRPWRWGFGDGHTAYGWTVRHAYTRAGRWRITVDAYDPGTRQWYNFDKIVLTVQR